MNSEPKEKGMSATVVETALNIFKNEWNKQIILYGPPGTSKTYSSTIIAANILAGKRDNGLCPYNDYDGARGYLDGITNECKTSISEENKAYKKGYEKGAKDKGRKFYEVVQFHPSYTYEDFVRGIKVEPKDEKLEYKVVSKIIEKISEKCENSGKAVLVIDEINRAPLASVLGELIYGLEYRDEEISTPYERIEENKNIPLKISKNLYIIGTMNTADRSIGSIDYAVRRRFAFIHVEPDGDIIEGSWECKSQGGNAEKIFNYLNANGKDGHDEGILRKPDSWNDDIDPEDLLIGHTYFLGLKDESKEAGYLEYRWDYQIKPILKEYEKDGLLKERTFADIIEDVEKILGRDNKQED